MLSKCGECSSGGDGYAEDKSERGDHRVSARGRNYRTTADPSRRTVLGEQGCRQLVDTEGALSGRGGSAGRGEARVRRGDGLGSSRALHRARRVQTAQRKGNFSLGPSRTILISLHFAATCSR